MNHRPLIGITTYAQNENEEITLPVQYVDSIRRAGGIPVLVPPGESTAEHLLARIDGLVLAGGGDIAPQCYGCDALHETVYMIDPERDETELALARQILASRFPTLAICRGIQIVNVALGGTLHQHLPDVVGDHIAHRAPPRVPVPHRVEVTSESRLAMIMQECNVSTVSWHHQAINHVAEPLRVVARAPDGVIEAVEMPDHPTLTAVQWHPELSSHEDVSQQRLFDRLVADAQNQ